MGRQHFAQLLLDFIAHECSSQRLVVAPRQFQFGPAEVLVQTPIYLRKGDVS